jgi:hypothetical protein
MAMAEGRGSGQWRNARGQRALAPFIGGCEERRFAHVTGVTKSRHGRGVRRCARSGTTVT